MKIQEFIGKSFVFAIAHGYDVVWRKFNVELKRSGCNITEALVLIAIYFEPERRASPSDLAEALRTSRGNISHCLAKLVRHGYLQRSMLREDARRFSISLTASGVRLAQRLIGEIEQIEERCERHFVEAAPNDVLDALYSL